MGAYLELYSILMVFHRGKRLLFDCAILEGMKRIIILGGIAFLLLGLLGVTLYGQRSQAAGDKYTFTARAIITSVDEANKSFKADVTKATGDKARDNMEGSNIEFKTGTAKVYKSIGGKDKRGTYHNFAIGQEVGLKGAAKADDTFELTFARIHQRSFNVIGLLQNHNETAKTLKISVITSNYKPGTYVKGTEITMNYKDVDTTFYSKSTKLPVSFDQVDANSQKVKVSGYIENASTWQVTQLIDGYAGK